jgi:hypothetical protein
MLADDPQRLSHQNDCKPLLTIGHMVIRRRVFNKRNARVMDLRKGVRSMSQGFRSNAILRGATSGAATDLWFGSDRSARVEVGTGSK